MQSFAILIQQPAIDFDRFLSMCHEMFGYSPSSASDASHRELSDSERFLSCLAAMKDQRAPVSLPPHLLAHVSFSVLVATNERDLLDVIECCSTMSFATADTVVRGVQTAVITGTLSQWKTAILSGCNESVEPSVRFLFNQVLTLFENAGLRVWGDCSRRTNHDNTLLLEAPK
jgi:hypothetical protein